jgi:hypothetical protein
MVMEIIDIDRVKFTRGCIEIKADSKAEAKKYAHRAESWANQFNQEVLIFYPGRKDPIRIPPNNNCSFNNKLFNMSNTNTNLILPQQGIVTAKGRISPNILEILYFLAENPEESAGLVRLADERQIALTDASIALFTESDGGLESAVERRREDYWHLGDLEEFNRLTRQNLEPNNRNSTIEFRLRTHDPNGENWLLSINRYRLVTDDRNGLYHAFLNLAVEACPTPIGV